MLCAPFFTVLRYIYKIKCLFGEIFFGLFKFWLWRGVKYLSYDCQCQATRSTFKKMPADKHTHTRTRGVSEHTQRTKVFFIEKYKWRTRIGCWKIYLQVSKHASMILLLLLLLVLLLLISNYCNHVFIVLLSATYISVSTALIATLNNRETHTYIYMLLHLKCLRRTRIRTFVCLYVQTYIHVYIHMWVLI